MLIFYGLGNNETKYLQTKHNVGRLILEQLASKYSPNWEKHETFCYAKNFVSTRPVYFLFSTGYMNNSGQPLANFIRYFKLDFSDKNSKVVILHDDSDQLENTVKFMPAGGSGGHKGVQNIYSHIPNLGIELEQIWRLKIGIRPKFNRQKSETFVLSRISSPEAEFLQQISQLFYQQMSYLVENNFARVQTEINTQK